jgi:formamidopyrimidine-DNA glycosylase
MPELPEVEALSRSLDRDLAGRSVERVVIRSVAVLKTYDPPAAALQGRTVSGAQRMGKFIDIELSSLHLVVHLARAGWLRVLPEAGETRPTLRGPLAARITFADGGALDVSEQGTEKRLALYVVRNPADVVGVARLGIDACDPELTAECLGGLLHAASGTIKSALADQSLVAGIGNAYSDEILHAARISPFRTAARLGDAEIQRLHHSMRRVLSDAIARALEVDPGQLRDSKRGSMSVHGRTGQPCPVCGDIVREVSLATRSFQYCATCQTGGKVYADRRLSRLLR